MNKKRTPIDELVDMIADVVIAIGVSLIIFNPCLVMLFKRWTIVAVLLWPHMIMLNVFVGTMVLIASLDDLIQVVLKAINYKFNK